jgi:P-type conjugative transfer protein VirB9
MQTKLKTLLVVALAAISVASHAQIDADPLPGDPKLVTFSYDENNSFRVFTRPIASTHIQFDADERVKYVAMGDTASWITVNRDNNLFVKPRFPNISTPATVVTTKRSYQFLFRSTTENGRWYQRVAFQNPSELLVEADNASRVKLSAVANDPSSNSFQPTQAEARIQQPVAPELLNFEYDVEGSAAVKPVNVFDDGFATYIQIKRPEDVPAVFRLLDKDIELIEYVLKGNTIVIPRVLDAGLLKLGKEEAKFFNRKRVAKKFFGGYVLEGSQP